MGLIFVGLGGYPVVHALGVAASQRDASLWIFGLSGASFVLLGLYLMSIDLAPRVAERAFPFIWAVIMTAITVSFAWTAFGPDEPAIEGGVTGTAVEGRIVFGLFAVVLLGPLAMILWRRAFRGLFGSRHTK
jgi:hypothetical protein